MGLVFGVIQNFHRLIDLKFLSGLNRYRQIGLGSCGNVPKLRLIARVSCES